MTRSPIDSEQQEEYKRSSDDGALQQKHLLFGRALFLVCQVFISEGASGEEGSFNAGEKYSLAETIERVLSESQPVGSGMAASSQAILNKLKKNQNLGKAEIEVLVDQLFQTESLKDERKAEVYVTLLNLRKDKNEIVDLIERVLTRLKPLSRKIRTLKHIYFSIGKHTQLAKIFYSHAFHYAKTTREKLHFIAMSLRLTNIPISGKRLFLNSIVKYAQSLSEASKNVANAYAYAYNPRVKDEVVKFGAILYDYIQRKRINTNEDDQEMKNWKYEIKEEIQQFIEGREKDKHRVEDSETESNQKSVIDWLLERRRRFRLQGRTKGRKLSSRGGNSNSVEESRNKSSLNSDQTSQNKEEVDEKNPGHETVPRSDMGGGDDKTLGSGGVSQGRSMIKAIRASFIHSGLDIGSGNGSESRSISGTSNGSKASSGYGRRSELGSGSDQENVSGSSDGTGIGGGSGWVLRTRFRNESGFGSGIGTVGVSGWRTESESGSRQGGSFATSGSDQGGVSGYRPDSGQGQILSWSSESGQDVGSEGLLRRGSGVVEYFGTGTGSGWVPVRGSELGSDAGAGSGSGWELGREPGSGLGFGSGSGYGSVSGFSPGSVQVSGLGYVSGRAYGSGVLGFSPVTPQAGVLGFGSGSGYGIGSGLSPASVQVSGFGYGSRTGHESGSGLSIGNVNESGLGFGSGSGFGSVSGFSPDSVQASGLRYVSDSGSSSEHASGLGLRLGSVQATGLRYGSGSGYGSVSGFTPGIVQAGGSGYGLDSVRGILSGFSPGSMEASALGFGLGSMQATGLGYGSGSGYDRASGLTPASVQAGGLGSVQGIVTRWESDNMHGMGSRLDSVLESVPSRDTEDASSSERDTETDSDEASSEADSVRGSDSGESSRSASGSGEVGSDEEPERKYAASFSPGSGTRQGSGDGWGTPPSRRSSAASAWVSGPRGRWG